MPAVRLELLALPICRACSGAVVQGGSRAYVQGMQGRSHAYILIVFILFISFILLLLRSIVAVLQYRFD